MRNKLEMKVDAVEPILRFNIEQSSEWLAFRFDYEEKLTWGEFKLVDPSGQERFLFWDVHSPREGVIHQNPANNNYLSVPGRIGSGQWSIEFKRLIPKRFMFEWEAGDGAIPSGFSLPVSERDYWTSGHTSNGKHFSLDLYDWKQVHKRGEHWYKGDFHTHTILSDGKMSPEQLTDLAIKQGLDFFVITDHNFIPSSWPKADILVIPGVEISSHQRGCWNIFGTHQTMDYWRTKLDNAKLSDAEFMENHNALRDQAGSLGMLRSINHPFARRVGWRAMGTLLSAIDVIEVWHCSVSSGHVLSNEAALILWSTLWNAGYQTPGIGGSDTHYADEPFIEGDPVQLVGDPITHVWTDQCSPGAILEGVRKRKVQMTRNNTILDASYQVGDQQYMIGDDLTEGICNSDGKVTCRLNVQAAVNSEVILIVNGQKAAKQSISEANQTLEFQLEWSDKDYNWTRYEVRDHNGGILALTNPVFSGHKQPTVFTWREIIEQANQIDPMILELLFRDGQLSRDE